MRLSVVDQTDGAARVTILGNGRAHLASQARVLHYFWDIETVALDEGELLALDTDLVIVSESLPEDERQQWVKRVRAEMPTMLVIKMNGYDSGPHAGADATVALAHGPGGLVSAIYELLTERGLASRPWAMSPEWSRVQ